MADLILPIAGLAILWSLLSKRSAWPVWRLPHPYLWLAGLFVILTGALIHTHLRYGEWSYWGYTNKLPGMVVISAYFCLGGWLVSNVIPSQLMVFLRTSVIFALGLMAIELAGLLWQDFYDFPQYTNLWPNYPLEGLMANRNVYALFALFIFAFIVCFEMTGMRLISQKLSYIAVGLLPFFMVEIGSRAGLIAAATMIISLVVMFKKRMNPFLLSLIAGTILFTGLYYSAPHKIMLIHYEQLDIVNHVEDLKDQQKSVEEVAQTLTYQGDNFRLQVLEISKDMIMDRPLFGSGLGSSFIEQGLKRGGRFDVIESTPLWLWVETGLIGLIIFGGFYIFCVRGIIQGMKGDDFYATFNKAMLVCVIVFTVMTCLHEMMYTRQIWFLLGMALAIPALKKHQAE